MTTRTHRAHLRRRTRLWQAGALVAGAAGVALFAAPIARLLGPSQVEITAESAGASGPAGIEALPTAADLDTARLGALLAGVNPAPPVTEAERKPPTPVVTAAAQPDTSEPPPPTPSGVWSFIGTAMTARGRHAIISAGGRQAIVREGATFEGVKLASIAADHITIERAGAPERIDRGALTNAWAQTPPRTAGAATPGGPGRPYQLGVSNQPGSLGQAMPLPVNPGGVYPPDRERVMAEIAERIYAMDAEQRIVLTKELTNPELTPESRRELLMRFGAGPNLDSEQQISIYKELGIEPEHHPALLKGLEEEALKR